MQIRCPYCGQVLPDSAAFCRFCGKKLTQIDVRREAAEMKNEKLAKLKDELSFSKQLLRDQERDLAEHRSSYSSWKAGVLFFAVAGLVVCIISIFMLSKEVSSGWIMAGAISFAVFAGCALGFAIKKGPLVDAITLIEQKVRESKRDVEKLEADIRALGEE